MSLEKPQYEALESELQVEELSGLDTVNQKLTNLSDKDKDFLDNAYNMKNLDDSVVQNVLSTMNDVQCTKVVSLLSDLKFHADPIAKKKIAGELAKFIDEA